VDPSGKVDDRILEAVSEAAGKYGLPALTVELIQREAGVSRASFYQYYSSVDDCFWHAYHHHAQGLVRVVEDAVKGASQPELAALAQDVAEWARIFSVGPKERAWSGDFAPQLPARDGRPARVQPIASAKGELPRERIIWATAATIREVGYRNMNFPTKADAFIATYEFAFQQTVAACIPAFFVSGAWPERVWHGAEAFARFMAREPLLAHLGFVEGYAIGPGFVPRVHDTQLAFTLFLEEGYRQRPEGQSLSRACSVLTAMAIFELGFQGIHRGPSLYIRRMQPLAVYIALAPFIGCNEAGDFVAGKLAATSPAPLVPA